MRLSMVTSWFTCRRSLVDVTVIAFVPTFCKKGKDVTSTWFCLTLLRLRLQANLPLLQRELLHCARLAKQNPAQYLAQHEQLLLDTSTTSPVDSSELLLDVNENGKRRTPDRWVNPKFISSGLRSGSGVRSHA